MTSSIELRIAAIKVLELPPTLCLQDGSSPKTSPSDSRQILRALTTCRSAESLPAFVKWINSRKNTFCGKKICLDNKRLCVETILSSGKHRKCATCGTLNRRCPLQIAWEITTVAQTMCWTLVQATRYMVESRLYLTRGVGVHSGTSSYRKQTSKIWNVFSDRKKVDSRDFSSESEYHDGDTNSQGLSEANPDSREHTTNINPLRRSTQSSSYSLSPPTLRTEAHRKANSKYQNPSETSVRVRELEGKLNELRNALEAVKSDAERTSKKHGDLQSRYRQRLRDAENLIQELLAAPGGGPREVEEQGALAEARAAVANKQLKMLLGGFLSNAVIDDSASESEVKEFSDLVFTTSNFACTMKQRLPLVKVMLERAGSASEIDGDMLKEIQGYIEECLSMLFEVPLLAARRVVVGKRRDLKRGDRDSDEDLRSQEGAEPKRLRYS